MSEHGFCPEGHTYSRRKNGRRVCYTCRKVAAKARARAQQHAPNMPGLKARPTERPGMVRLPVEPIQNWLLHRACEWFIEWGCEESEDEMTPEYLKSLEGKVRVGHDWGRIERMLHISDRALRRIRNGHGSDAEHAGYGVHLDTIDRMLLEVGETYALEMMYPLEGLEETADYERNYRRDGRHSGKYNETQRKRAEKAKARRRAAGKPPAQTYEQVRAKNRQHYRDKIKREQGREVNARV